MKWLYLPKKLYFKPGSMEVALKELDEVYKVSKAFIVTSSEARENGCYKAVNEWVNGRGIRTCEFYASGESASERVAKSGIQKMQEFEPQVVIAAGGAAVQDTARLMIKLYGKTDGMLVSVPSGPDMGSACSLVCRYVDSEGKAQEIWGLDNLPEIAAIDADFFGNPGKEDLQKSAMETIAKAKAVINMDDASHFTRAFAKDAVELTEKYLPLALGTDEKARTARERLANADVLATIAYGNAFFPEKIQ